MNNNIFYTISLVVILIYYCFYNLENYDDVFVEDNGLDKLTLMHEEAKILKKRLENVKGNLSNEDDTSSGIVKYNNYKISNN